MRDVCAIIFILIFAGLAFVQALTRGAGESDAARVAVLARQSLAEAKSSSGDWPLWRGPARDGIALDDISANWPDGGPAKLWEQRTGEGSP